LKPFPANAVSEDLTDRGSPIETDIHRPTFSKHANFSTIKLANHTKNQQTATVASAPAEMVTLFHQQSAGVDAFFTPIGGGVAAVSH